MTNCTNCGAVLTSNQCEYCGTIYETKPKYNLLNFASSYGISFEQAIGMSGLFDNPEQVMKDAEETAKLYRAEIDPWYDNHGNLHLR